MTKSDRTSRFTFRLPTVLLNQLREEAEELGVSVNARILQILWEWADHKNMKKGC